MMSAICASLSWPANGGITLVYFTPPMVTPCAPCNTVWMCRLGSASFTAALPLSGGNAPGMPSPLAWWQAEQLAAYNDAPLAASKR